ncbi:MAG: TldD/PmbA family protein [Candidatus Edwardsbacteria bacterium]|nr:TldD/PmbA family protein [Candidatus Edwardsbacteria bacterium]MBU1576005.1 TldD/PmbA family protein [Candidatus Edwardsbacteria bacterium]MBU2463932.1 TldD/PmbA family protein [Candidatus Edwardsbacteria bacterium]MBU2592928.1 TldD/PmbA family protein [Candidatus Edwardsbacteria bacterium]
MMIDKNQAQDICKKALSFVKEGQAEVILNQVVSPLTRIANNTIHQNVETSDINISLRVDLDNRSGRATTNQFDDESLKKLAKQAVNTAKAITSKQDLPPLVGPQKYREIAALDKSSAFIEPEQRAEMVLKAVNLAKQEKVELAGLVNNTLYVNAMANSNGLFAYHNISTLRMEITARSGITAGRYAQIVRKTSELDPEKVASIAIQKCLGGLNPKALEPGDYTVILEPEAVTTPLMFLAWLSFGALSVQENLSCLSGKLGQKLMGDNITITDDAYHPLAVWAEPFDSEGMPKKKVSIIEKGVAKGPVYDLKTAAKDRTETTGHGLPQPNTWGPMPRNIILEGGSSTLEDMIKSTKRGVLVTRFWYNRVVDRKIPIITGMTRDGTFLIEDGKISCGVKNMRFNQDLVEFFNNVETLGVPESQENMVVPPLKVNNFHFTGLTEA